MLCVWVCVCKTDINTVNVVCCDNDQEIPNEVMKHETPFWLGWKMKASYESETKYATIFSHCLVCETETRDLIIEIHVS